MQTLSKARLIHCIIQNHQKDFKGKSKGKSLDEDNKISLDTRITLNLFENLKYDLSNIRLGESVKPVYLSKLPPDLKNIKST